ncbi:MAG: hypothetical protein A2W23_06740 [Planctomycetes bacterium RBG_16_43_13]|nr:MAG: hypothetical protein A2W23_06740 [Planctomycetes bacterium RBG_16_43_13]
MDKKVTQLVERFISIRGDNLAPPETRKELLEPIENLDKVYWSEVGRIFDTALDINPNSIILDKQERLIVDSGLLDDRIIANPQNVRNALLKELYADSGANRFYFSEWLAERYRAFVLYGEVEASFKEMESKDKRLTLYKKVRHLFVNLPGVSDKITEMLLSGKIDEAINISEQDDRKNKLIDLRSKILALARYKAKTDSDLNLFDQLASVDRTIMSEQTSSIQSTNSGSKVATAKRTEFVRREIRLVRSLLKLGISGSGLFRTHSVLLSDKKRMTKNGISEILALVRDADPHIPSTPSILIAPYIGTGFYEWDRNTVFVPLISTRSEEESIVTGLANFRIMLDTLQDEGRIKSAYERRFGSKDFRESFINDYKNWVLHIGRGFRGSMDAARYEFFKDYIGPSAQDLFAVGETAGISPEERINVIKECRAKLNKKEGGFYEHYRLAICYWKENRGGEAMEQIVEAVKTNDKDVRALFSLGYLYQLGGRTDKATAAYKRCADTSPHTIWFAYAMDALQRL